MSIILALTGFDFRVRWGRLERCSHDPNRSEAQASPTTFPGSPRFFETIFGATLRPNWGIAHVQTYPADCSRPDLGSLCGSGGLLRFGGGNGHRLPNALNPFGGQLAGPPEDFDSSSRHSAAWRTSSRLDFTPSLVLMCSMWLSTVLTLTVSCSAISRTMRPCPTSSKI